MAIEFQPYVGPRPFEQGEQALFFGRDGEASELLSLVVAHAEVLLYAPSGAGKTSLINARLIPLLEEEGFEVLPLARVQGLIPEDIQSEEIPNLYVFNTLMSWAEEETDPRQLAQMSIAGFLLEREHPTDEAGLPAPRVVIFDQFEELITFYPEHWRDREAFFEQVGDALEEDSLLRVVFVIREDRLAQLDPYTHLLPEKLRTRFRLERLRERAALTAVTGPLRDTRRSFAEGVAEKLVEDLLKIRFATAAGDPVEAPGQFTEPVQLQVVCQSLWQVLPPDVTVITRDHLQVFGDVDQALSGFYERSITRAAQEPGVSEGDLRAWFDDTLITPAGTRGTIYRGQEKTGGIPNVAVDALENQHLIRGEWRAGARWYELTHDRFIGPIQRSNETWRAARRDRWLRIGGGVAAVIIFLIMGIAVLLTTEATQTAQGSQATAAAAAAEVSEAKATAGVAAIEATQAARQSQATITAAAAESSELATSVLRARVRPVKPGLSVSGAKGTAGTISAFVRDTGGEFFLLSMAAVLGSPDYDLGSPVIQPGGIDGGQAPDDVIGNFAKYLPLADGVSVANLVGLARLEEGLAFETTIPGIGPIRGVRDPTPGMSVRMLGRTTGLTTGEIMEVDKTFNMPSPRLADKGISLRFMNGIASSPMSEAGDGGALVVDEEGYAIGVVVAASQEKTILAPIQDVLDRLGVQLVYMGQELFTLKGHAGRVLGAAWSPDGARIVTAGQDGTARLWDAQTGEELVVLRGHKDRVNLTAFSPDGQWVVTASRDGTARVWVVATGKELAVLRHGGGVNSAAFSPDGQWVVTASHDDTARVWEAATGKELAVLRGHKGSVWSAAFSPDGQWVVTASWDDTARVWEAATGKELAVLRGHEDSVRSAVFSPDGQWLVTGSDDGTARVWASSNFDTTPFILELFGDAITGVAFSPDGSRLVIANADGIARLAEVGLFVNQTMINAFFQAAEELGQDGWPLLVKAGLDHLVSAREKPYTGPAIEELPNLTDQEKVAVKRKLSELVPELRRRGGQINAVAWSPGGTRLVLASSDDSASVWDVAKTDEPLFTLDGHTDDVLHAVWSPDGVRIVTVGADGTARVWQGR